jgi:hypothetical protein
MIPMSSPQTGVPAGRQAEIRWREFDPGRRRSILLRGSDPSSNEEAGIVLGYARRIRERLPLMASLGAVSAFVVWLAISMLVEDGVSGQSMLLAGVVAVSVGLGLLFGGRVRARRLERRAEEALSPAS